MNISSKINNIFNNLSNKIKIINPKFRNTNIDIASAVLYRFKYAQKNVTKSSICSSMNYINKNNYNRTSYYRKEKSISVELYKNFFEEIKNVYKNICNIDPEEHIFVGVDGTYLNNIENGKLKTSLNMGYMDITNNIPLDLTFKGFENKNGEVNKLIEYVKNGNFKNVTVIVDRAYFSYELIKVLELNNITYIIRLKKNSTLLDPKKIKLTNVRIIDHEDKFKKVVKIKGNKLATITVKSDIKLVTNLGNKYSVNNLLNLYKSRWDIEVFFKLIKTNFKFENMKEKNSEDQYSKNIYCELIITYISKIVSHLFLKDKEHSTTIVKRNNSKRKNKKMKTVECSYKINNSNLINGIFEHLIDDVINGTLTNDQLTNFTSSYSIIIKNELGRKFERISKTPFKKWYIKGYLNIYKYSKIIEALINNNTEKLNKNLKTITKDILIA